MTVQYIYMKLTFLEKVKLMQCCFVFCNRVVVCSLAVKELTGSRIQWFKSIHKQIEDKKYAQVLKLNDSIALKVLSLQCSDRKKKGKFPVYIGGNVFPNVYIDNVVCTKHLPLTVFLNIFCFLKKRENVGRTFLPLEFSCCFFPMHGHNFLYVTS